MKRLKPFLLLALVLCAGLLTGCGGGGGDGGGPLTNLAEGSTWDQTESFPRRGNLVHNMF